MLNIPSSESIQCGQAAYTLKTLLLYDMLVIKFSNRFAWQCPRQTLINFFRENISHNHLDIGVGTGYFLQKIQLVPDKQRLGLLDLNKDCLNYAKKRLKRFQPEIYHHDIFEEFTSVIKKFDSVSLNYVLHCLPGELSQKSVVFDHSKSILNQGGKLFGATILGKGVNRNLVAKKLMTIYNKKKIFSNANDDNEVLFNELKKRFSSVQIKINGCVAMFVAQ